MLDPVFQNAVQVSLVNEGVLSDNPNDHGGLTKYGITQKTWYAYWVRKTYPSDKLPQNVRDITRDQAINFYYSEFWLAGGMNKMPAEIAPAVFDFAINSGLRRALAYYGLLKLKGNETAGQLRRARNNYVAMRGRFLMNICQRDHTQITFVEGWFNRIIGQLDFAY
jgi:lysozyme family protein